MTKRYYAKENYWYDLETGEIEGRPGKFHLKQAANNSANLFIISDHKPYKSPVTGEVIDGKYERREHMKRHGLREVETSEFKPVYRNPEFCRKHGISPDRMAAPLPKSERIAYDAPPSGIREKLLQR